MKAEKPFFLRHQLIFLRFFLLSLYSPSAAANGDSRRLLSFKQSLPDPDQLPNWRPTISPCNYNGISCNNTRVSSINLSNHNLNITFSEVASFLLPLQNLESLVLKNASISGAINPPPEFSCSDFLSLLDLAENTISGPISDVSTLKLCPSLVSLNLSGNLMNPFDEKVAAVSGVSSLHVIDLSYNRISGDDVALWVLSNEFPELQHLSLKGNMVSGSLPELSLTNLMHLDLSFNNFSTTFPVLKKCSNLRYLDLSSNRFFGDVEENSFSSCGKLSFLNLTSNQLAGAVAKLLLPLGSLQFVYLKQNHFHGVFPLISSESCSTLLELDVSVNNLTGTLPQSLGECSVLELLDASTNNFSGELPVETLLKLRNLRVLLMPFNNFEGQLPDSLSRLVHLEILDVSSNTLSGPITSGLCQDPNNNLRVLYLQNNLFTGVVPEGLSNCSKLASLDLSFNYLTGTIPPSLGSLSELKDMMMLLNQLSGDIPQEFMYLQSLENLLLDFNYLTGSIPSSLSNCTNLNWISLSNNELSGEIPASLGRLLNLAILQLDNNSLSGRIPGELGDCRSLIWLDLNTNFLNGIIPPALFKQSGYIDKALLTGKRYVYIKNNGGSKQCHGAGNLLEFGGVRDEQMDRVSTRNSCNSSRRVWKGITEPNFNHNGSMIFLDLSYNKLDGSIPMEVGSMFYLMLLNLGHNALSGPIPDELGGLQNVAILDLSYNRLNGTIPHSLTSLRLGDIDLSNNNLTGTIPESAPLDTFPDYRFVNNSGLCGYPLPSCGPPLDGAGSSQRLQSNRKQASLAASVAMGLALSLFCIFGLAIVVVEMKKRRKKKEAALEAYIENHSNSGTAWKISAREALTISLATFDERQPLRNLKFSDLLEATNGFHSDTLIGSGGFGDVYKARLRDGSVVAIKKLKHVSGQGDREFIAEMETIGKVKHRNLVPLLGYCRVGEERLLVYEYMKYGSLEDVLQDFGMKLSWPARRRIAIGAARGLAFLHCNCTPHIIHRDMKSSNVLIDQDLEARVSDFGMARTMTSTLDTHLSVSTLAGTPGYVPPEYYQSFQCSTKGDVYSFGVVLLELLTGRRPTDSPDFGDNNLVGWVRQQAKVRAREVFDPMLLMDRDPSTEMELVQHLRIAFACLDDRPLRRPTMIGVMTMFKEIQAGAGVHSASSLAVDHAAGFTAADQGIEMSVR